MIFGEPYTLLCKRDFTIGEDDLYKCPFTGLWKGEHKKVYLIKDKWYPITWTVTNFTNIIATDWFHTVDEQGGRHAFYIDNDPESPRSYAKWFHTPAEWRDKQINSILDETTVY